MSHQYEPDNYYVRITERFKRLDGTSSWYNMLSGNGQFTVRIPFKDNKFSKAVAREYIHKVLKQAAWDLDSYSIIEQQGGFYYERYLKTDDSDSDVYEIVKKGEHTDHEVFDVYVFYIEEDSDAWETRLK